MEGNLSRYRARGLVLLAGLIAAGLLALLPATAKAQSLVFDRAFGAGVDTGGAGFENCTTASGCQAGTASIAAGGMNFPNGVAVDAQGRILVADVRNYRVDRFTVAGDGTVSFDRAFGANVDPGGGAGFENCTTASGCRYGTGGAGTGGTGGGIAGGMVGPNGVAVDAQGGILVADAGNHRVDRFTVAGDGTVSFDRAFGVNVNVSDGETGDFENCTTASGCRVGTPSFAAGGMNLPTGVAVDAQGRILVADFNRVDRFTVAGDGTVSFDRAFGVNVDPSDGDTGDFENCTTASGCRAGTASGAAGGMDPTGVAVDAQGGILVADFANHRVDRFTVAGDGTVSFDRAFGADVNLAPPPVLFENCTTASGCQAGTISGDAGGMYYPRGVAVDAQGRILVGGNLTRRVDRFTVAGDGTVSFDRAFGVNVDPSDGDMGDFENCTTASGCQAGTASAAAGGMSNPFGVATDAQGGILVADNSSHRVHRLTVSLPPPPVTPIIAPVITSENSACAALRAKLKKAKTKKKKRKLRRKLRALGC